MRLSIIIAVYNGEETIARALNSVLNSTLNENEYEIIIINDGSTDSTVNVVTPYLNQFHNIKLINKKNGGQSTARNIGFEEARGKYIFCLDSDDYLESTLLESELVYAEQNTLDLYPITFIRKTDDSFRTDYHYPILDKIVTGPELMCRYTISGSMCMYFYRRQIIEDNNLRLMEGVFQEDEEFLIRFLTYSNRILHRQTKLYYYVIHSASTTNNKSINHRIKLLDDLIKIITVLGVIESGSSSPMLKEGVCKKKEQLLISLFVRMYEDKFKYDLVQNYVNILKEKKLYPLKIRYNSYKFKMLSFIINNPLLLKTIFKWN